MIVRSSVKWMHEGEKHSKYFCNLEKRNFVQKAMRFIERDNGEIIHDNEAITKEVKNFYKNLNASREDAIVSLTWVK